MHPGWADTPGLADSLPGFVNVMGPILRTAAEGVDTLIWLATLRDVGRLAGQFVHDHRARPFDRVPMTRIGREDRARLWDAIAGLARVEEPSPGRCRHCVPSL